MNKSPSQEQLRSLSIELATERPLPHQEDAEKHRIVYWHVFREEDEAMRFANHIQLVKGEQLVGGCHKDSIGPLCWVGVQVEDIGKWGNRAAIHKIDFNDPENPKSPTL